MLLVQFSSVWRFSSISVWTVMNKHCCCCTDLLSCCWLLLFRGCSFSPHLLILVNSCNLKSVCTWLCWWIEQSNWITNLDYMLFDFRMHQCTECDNIWLLNTGLISSIFIQIWTKHIWLCWILIFCNFCSCNFVMKFFFSFFV